MQLIELAVSVLLATACAEKNGPERPLVATDTDLATLPNSMVVRARGTELHGVGSDGKRLWSLALSKDERFVGKIRIAANSSIYVRTTSGLRAASPEGEWLWTAALPVDPKTGDALAHSPAVLTDSSAFVLVEENKYRAYSLSGDVRWELLLDEGEHPRGAPDVAPDGQIYVDTDARLYAISPKGTVSWRLPH